MVSVSASCRRHQFKIANITNLSINSKHKSGFPLCKIPGLFSRDFPGCFCNVAMFKFGEKKQQLLTTEKRETNTHVSKVHNLA